MPDVVLKWRGAEYRVPDTQVFDLAARIEEVATIGEIARWGAATPFTKVAKCYGIMLRFAGCRVSDQEVHREMMASVRAGRSDQGTVIMAAMAGIMAVLMDGAPEGGADSDAGGEIPAS